MTYREIASVLGVSTECVRQIEKRAIAKLMHPRNRQKWEVIKGILYEIEAENAKKGGFNGRKIDTRD